MAVALKSFHLPQNTHRHTHTSRRCSRFLTKNRNPIQIRLHSPPIPNQSRYRLLLTLLSSSSSPSTRRPIHVCEARKLGANTGLFSLSDDGDGDGADDDGDDAADFDESADVDRWFDVLEDYIDSIWIRKVFGSYGVMLPAIILSLLLATGLKTFLMALAIPLTQSTLSFAVQRTLINKGNKRRRKTKTKRGSRRSRASIDQRGVKESLRKGKKLNPFGAQKKDNNSSVSSSSRSSNGRGPSRFGGWEELDEGTDSFSGYYYSVGEASKSDESKEVRDVENGSSGKRIIENDDGPLLLRMLVSFFPFLELLD